MILGPHSFQSAADPAALASAAAGASGRFGIDFQNKKRFMWAFPPAVSCRWWAVKGEVEMNRRVANLFRSAWIEYQRDRAEYLAAAMIYYAIVSLIPLLALLLSVLGLLLRYSSTAAEIEQKMMIRLKTSFGEHLPAAITGFLQTLQQESIIGTIISLASVFLAASVLFRHLRLSFRAIWKYEPPLISGSVPVILRTVIRERVISLAMVLGGAGLLLGALGLITTVQWISGFLDGATFLDQAAGWSLGALSSLVIDVITFALLFKVLPPVSMRWRDVGIAALFCALVWVAAGGFLTLYGALFGSTRSAYGPIGWVFVAILWIKIVSQALFFGAEICKVSAIGGDRPPFAASEQGPPGNAPDRTGVRPRRTISE